MVPPPPSYGDLSNHLVTLRGQNTAPPLEKVFDFHSIVQVPSAVGSQYFDPSYAAKPKSKSDIATPKREIELIRERLLEAERDYGERQN